jgi:uncharacterized protein HemY
MLHGSPDIFGRAYAECGLANVLRQQGHVDWGLGQVYLRRGQLTRARPRFHAAYKAFKNGGEARGEVLSLQSLAQVAHALGNSRKGEDLFDAALRRARSAGLHAHLEIFT